MSEQAGIVKRLFSGFWNGLTRLRVALSNILFLLLLLLLLLVFTGGAPEPLPATAALVLNPVGNIVEQKSYSDPFALLFGEPLPSEREVLLRDVLEAIAYAKDDPGITALVMELGQLFNVGISKSGEINAALEDFRSSGKPIIARSDFYSQGQYLLAAQADTVILHPLGGVQLEGFSNFQWYFKDALEKLSLSMHVFRAGEHKSFAEPFMRSDMSAGEKAISQRWLGDLWGTYTASIEQQRTLPGGAVDQYIADFLPSLQEHNGDMARLALAQKLVDRVEGRSEANDFLVDLVGEADEEGRYQGVGFERYLAQKKPVLDVPDGANRVGIITARGSILDGEQPAGSIGGDSLSALITQAAEDVGIKAIVLRIDSGGGSAFASEIIRQKVLYAKSKGKPLVVSMGSVAASGGYWISAPADEIWATDATITGSIGVFAAFPTIERLLERFGVYTDGVGTTDMAGAFRADRTLNPVIAHTVQASVDNLYTRFITLVAEGRAMTPDAVDAIAGGRVWSGKDALEIGLVDKIGGLEDAVNSAALLAGLDEYELDYVEAPLSPQELIAQQLMGQAQRWSWLQPTAWQSVLSHWAAPLSASLSFVAEMNDPSGLYARCTRCTGI